MVKAPNKKYFAGVPSSWAGDQGLPYQDDHVTPLPQRGSPKVALYVDGGIAAEILTAIKCHVASGLAPAVPNPDTDDEPGMTSGGGVG